MSYPTVLQRRFTSDEAALYVDDDATGERRCRKDIFQAAVEGDVEAIKANLALGVDVNVMGQPSAIWGPRFEKSGHFAGTALHYATSYGREEAVAFLLEKGARVDVRSASGHTAKDYARRRGYLNILAMLDHSILRQAANAGAASKA